MDGGERGMTARDAQGRFTRSDLVQMFPGIVGTHADALVTWSRDAADVLALREEEAFTVARTVFAEAEQACRDDTIAAYRDVYGPDMTPAAEALMRAGWAEEGTPALVLVSDSPVDPGAFTAAIEAPDPELDARVAGIWDTAEKQGLTLLPAPAEDES
jgi:hypothetical protein